MHRVCQWLLLSGIFRCSQSTKPFADWLLHFELLTGIRQHFCHFVTLEACYCTASAQARLVLLGPYKVATVRVRIFSASWLRRTLKILLGVHLCAQSLRLWQSALLHCLLFLFLPWLYKYISQWTNLVCILRLWSVHWKFGAVKRD